MSSLPFFYHVFSTSSSLMQAAGRRSARGACPCKPCFPILMQKRTVWRRSRGMAIVSYDLIYKMRGLNDILALALQNSIARNALYVFFSWCASRHRWRIACQYAASCRRSQNPAMAGAPGLPDLFRYQYNYQLARNACKEPPVYWLTACRGAGGNCSGSDRELYSPALSRKALLAAD